MKRKISILAFIVLLLLAIPFIYAPASFAMTQQLSAPVILKLGNDKAIDYTVNEILTFIPTAIVISINDVNALKDASKSSEAYTVFVGHGSQTGLAVGKELIPWALITNIIQNSPFSTYMLDACYSQSAHVDSKITFGFPGQVGVDTAAMWTIVNYYSYIQQYSKVPEVMQHFVSIFQDKCQHPATSFTATLDYSANSVLANDMWWNVYSGDPLYPVYYTHPDIYNVYTSVGLDTDWSITSDGIQSTHLTRVEVSQASFAPLLQIFAGTVAITLTGLAAAITAGGAAIVAGIIALIAGGESYLVQTYVKAEKNDGWIFGKNLAQGGCPPWYWEGTASIKIGGLMWIDFGYYFNYLGVGGYYVWPEEVTPYQYIGIGGV